MTALYPRTISLTHKQNCLSPHHHCTLQISITLSKTTKEFQLKNYFSYILGHCNEKQKARGSFYKRKNIILNFLLFIFSENITIGVHIETALGIVFSLKLQISLKNIISSHIQNTTRTLRNEKKNIKLLKMFSSPFQQQQALCWPSLLFAFIAVSSIIAEGTEYSRTPLIYLTNSHTS